MPMNLMPLPRVEQKLPPNVKEIPLPLKDVSWLRAVAAGTLVAGVYLLLTGRRKAGITAAAAGTAAALLEDQKALKHWWENVPTYIKTAQNFLVRAEGYFEDLGHQGEHVKRILRKAR